METCFYKNAVKHSISVVKEYKGSCGVCYVQDLGK